MVEISLLGSEGARAGNRPGYPTRRGSIGRLARAALGEHVCRAVESRDVRTRSTSKVISATNQIPWLRVFVEGVVIVGKLRWKHLRWDQLRTRVPFRFTEMA